LATQLVKLRRSATQSAIPTIGQLELGELALNTYDGKVYMKKNVGGTETIVQVGITNYPDSQTLSFGTDSDLVISHNGSNSIINQTGTGTLQIQVDESTVLDISSSGLDITGDITLDGTVDGVDVAQLKTDFDAHEHEGTQILSTGTPDGYVLTASGTGTSVWEAIPYIDTLQSVTDRGAVTTNEITVPSIVMGDARLIWNDIDGTVDLQYDNVSLQIGQEQHIYAKAIEAIPDGAPVMFAGAQGDHMLVRRADQNVAGFVPDWIIGLATSEFTINEFGYVAAFGLVRNLDTTSYTAGDILYLDDASPAGLTTTPPVAPSHTITIASAVRISATVGTLFVRVAKSNYLQELSDVAITTTPGDKNLIQYNTSTSTWTDTSAATLDYLTLRPDEDLAHAEGKMYYNDEYKALTVFTDVVGSSLQVGLEDWVRVLNNTGSAIPNGTPVYATGASGEVITIAPADATTEAKAQVLGIATNTIANGAQGWATTRGFISGIDTSTLTAGLRIHLAPDGSIQNAAPTYPYYPTDLGTCVVSDATNGYIYVDIKEHSFEQLRISGNAYIDGNTTVVGNLTVQGTQTITNEANLSISDSFIYFNSGDTIGAANTTFSGTGLDDFYFSNHYEGTTTTTYYLRIDGVGTGTGGVDTFEWSKDNFATTEATGVDLDFEVLLDNNICAHFEALTGHTLNDTWSGTAAPVNVDTGWFSNRNTGTSGVGYTHLGIYFDVSDGKFKFVESYEPEPSGTINSGHASYTLGTLAADTFEGTATNSILLENEAGSHYLDYTNFTNTPTIGNATVTLTAGDGLGTGGSFTTNQTGNSTVTFTNTDKGSSQNIFKSFEVSGQDTIFADSNSESLEIVAGNNITISTNDATKQLTITAADDGDYLPSTGGTLTGALILTGSLTLDDTQLITNAVTTTSTAETTVASFAAATYRTNKHVIQITDSVSGEYHAVEILVIHDGTDAYKTEYAEVTTGAAALASFDVDISAGNVRLLATPATTNSTTFKIVTQNTKT